MAIRTLRLITLVLAALTLSLSFCHLLEMPARLAWDVELWVDATVRGGVFELFGTVGAAVEVAAVLATLVLAGIMRTRRPLVRTTAGLAAVLFVLALGYWWLQVYPANQEFAGWADAAPPPDWGNWRTQWEYGHAVRAVMHLAGFILLCCSVVAETPERPRQAK